MEITYCRYHPAQPATWHCSPCQRDFGDCCIPLNADAPELEPQCPLCAGKLQFLGAANTAQPFWQRIPLFFRYGLQPGPLLFAAALCLASLFMPAWKLLWLALFCVATKYLQSVIESSSQGVREAPALQGAFDGEGFSLFWRLLVIFFIAFAVVWLAADFDSEALFWAATLGVQLLIPASIIRLALDKTLSAALSPDQVGAVIKAMGWRYLILWVFLFILWQSPDAVVYMLSSGLPRVVLMPIAALLFGYFSVVMCAMMGYAVFQYQGALGYVAVDESAPRGVPAEEYRRRRALADAEVRVKEGQSAQALEVLAKALDVAPNDLKLNERFHQLLFGLGARERCLRHLEHYLPLAARLNPAQGAFALLNARQFKADYLPEDALVCERLAEALLQRHKTREGLSLLRNLHQRFPDYPHIPRAYLLAARGFAEGLGQVETAQRLLAYIRARYPQSPLLGEVASLEETLRRLAAQA
ncbi:DUF4013 domain-containing protein [Aquipseudomonas alcaligenes]|uniref:Tetratricopeptide repeat protein n=1 Tax=Aquipseudomonas alcaligenes TaxID=43263 RepID=A0AB73HUW6_AQUAC|nr:DUF4013 domain-containing protein [Pseudomonas alcaligenes]MDH0141811.1 hypothetical protein [Pseudomonas alcaligenes]